MAVMISKLNPQYVTDMDGNRVSIILSIEDFNDLMEDMEDLAVIAERKDEIPLSHEQILAELMRDGIVNSN